MPGGSDPVTAPSCLSAIINIVYETIIILTRSRNTRQIPGSSKRVMRFHQGAMAMSRSIEAFVRRIGWRLSQALFACGVLLGAAPAQAGFKQATCTTASFDTAVPTNLGALEFLRQSTTPAGG